MMSKGHRDLDGAASHGPPRVGEVPMTDSPTCPSCEQSIRASDSVIFWPDRQTMEHLWCHIDRCHLDIFAEVEASADPAYGPMS